MKNLIEKFATTRNFTSTYAGDAIRAYILKALFGGETLSTSGIKLEENVKYKRHIKKFTSADIVQSGSCDFTPAGTLTITEGVLEPQKLKINEQICFEDIYPLWDSAEMAAGMNSEDVPASLMDAITDEFVGRMGEYVEQLIWQGDTVAGTFNIIDGYEKLLDNGTPVAVPATPITPANVLAEFGKITTAQPKAIALKPAAQKVMFVSVGTAESYQQSLDAQGINTSQDEKGLTYHGIEVRSVGGITDGVIVLGLRDNFYSGTDLTSDWTQLKALDQRDVDGSEFINFVLKGKIDVAIGWTTEIVYYS